MSYKYKLALHGGAGAIAIEKLSSSQKEKYNEALLKALAKGESVLQSNGTALDAVVATVSSLEDCPLFNAGIGAVLASHGGAELDACLMEGHTEKAGAVTYTNKLKNPIQVAQAILQDSTPHVLLAGDGAHQWARQKGFELVDPSYFITEQRQLQLEKAIREKQATLDHDSDDFKGMGTVGAVALDKFGHLAAATSTGGMTNKLTGRVSDSSIVGAGNYANSHVAISTTGEGDYFIRAVTAHHIACLCEMAKLPLSAAVDQALKKVKDLGGSGGVIAINSQGEINLSFNTLGMFRAWVSEGESPQAGIN